MKTLTEKLRKSDTQQEYTLVLGGIEITLILYRNRHIRLLGEEIGENKEEAVKIGMNQLDVVNKVSVLEFFNERP